ncbi:MAG: hypothetical protein KC800_26245 [Candidatus Eremiobacteraeota bacterium]|nr:hypothetical protein [Candidatus Eremiobacteraeota bacterium]
MRVFFSLGLLVMLFLTVPATAQTNDDLSTVLSACQFFAGGPLTQQEIEAIVNETRGDFQRDPQGATQQISQLKAIGGQLSQAQDPFQMVAVRQLALYEFYNAYQSGNRTTSMEIVLRKANPMAVDPGSQILLLESDLLGTVNYFDMLRQGRGGSPMSDSERRQFASQIVANFQSLPDEAKTFIITSQIFGSVLQSQLQQMSANQQQQVRQQIAQQQAPQMSMSDYQALSAMSRAQHLSTMNILEAAGGSDDYWSTVERPSW